MINELFLNTKYCKSTLWVLVILLNAACAECMEKQPFYRTDIRLSKFGELQTSGYCSSKKECASECFSSNSCHSVRLFPLTEGFLSEHLPVESSFDDKHRFYEDLNAGPYILGPIGTSDQEESRHSDQSFVMHGPVTKINIWSGYVVDGIQLTYGSVLGSQHGYVTLNGASYTTLHLSENEYISMIRWGACQGAEVAFNGCICQFYMETNKGNSVGPLGYGDVGEFHELHGHRLLYINSSSAVVSDVLVLTKMMMQFGFHFQH